MSSILTSGNILLTRPSSAPWWDIAESWFSSGAYHEPSEEESRRTGHHAQRAGVRIGTFATAYLQKSRLTAARFLKWSGTQRRSSVLLMIALNARACTILNLIHGLLALRANDNAVRHVGLSACSNLRSSINPDSLNLKINNVFVTSADYKSIIITSQLRALYISYIDHNTYYFSGTTYDIEYSFGNEQQKTSTCKIISRTNSTRLSRGVSNLKATA